MNSGRKLTTSAMIASFADPGQRTASAPFGHALNRLAEERPEIVGLSADLAKYTDMHVFRDAHPDRFFQMGMAEQTLLGAAADAIREHRGSPSVLICDTRIGCGVPLLENREKAHFMRVDAHEWQIARDQLQEGAPR